MVWTAREIEVLDIYSNLPYIACMTPIHTAARAVILASRRRGVTADELAREAGVSLQVAQRTLARLAGAGLLWVAVPERKGKRRGDWRNTYTLQQEDTVGAVGNGRPNEQKRKERRRAHASE